MEAGKRVSGRLIPGLPEELVQAHLLPRLPWYTRPVCRAISKSWRACIDTCNTHAELRLRTRSYQLPLLRGLCLLCTFDTQMFITRDCVNPGATYYDVQWQDNTYQIHRQWRKLPPLRDLLRQPPARVGLLASSGMVYVWSNKEPTVVLKMDMGCGDWTWSKFSVPHGFNSLAVAFNGKIYVPRVRTGESESGHQEVVLAHDMMAEQTEQVKSWYRDNLSLLVSRSSLPLSHGEEQMYSFEEQESTPDEKLELLVYDPCKDSWKTQDEIPIPECRWSEVLQLKLLDAECFEPTPEKGSNTIWIDSEGEVISWFNPSMHDDWVEFNYNSTVKGKGLEYIQIDHGLLYGIFIEDEDEDRDDDEEEGERDGQQEQGNVEGGQHAGLIKLTITKGRMSVASSDVQWQEVHDIGCFKDRYYLQPAVVSPIEHYTFMA